MPTRYCSVSDVQHKLLGEVCVELTLIFHALKIYSWVPVFCFVHMLTPVCDFGDKTFAAMVSGSAVQYVV